MILSWYYSARLREFEKNLSRVEEVQRKNLRRILNYLRGSEFWARELGSVASYEEIAARLPMRAYEDFQNPIEQQRNSGRPLLTPEVTRFEPTSGSSSQRKWIPYSPGFLSEMNRAAAVWMADTYRQYPGIKSGPHYWSLSWLPQDLRALTSSDDAELFPWWQKFFLHKLMAVPPALSLAPSPEAAWHATLCFLYSQKNLSLISVWSPSFLLKLLKDLKERQEQIEADLTRSSWGYFEAELRPLLAPPPPRRQKISVSASFAQELWPNLQLISAWDSALAQTWWEELRRNFPGVALQGKGLWATEGVVTFPYQGRKILAASSHFYEFRCLASGKILPAWKLEEGQEVQPLLWTSSGLLRYSLADRLKVTGFVSRTPCFEFLGRLQGVDLVGEKMDAVAITAILQKIAARHRLRPLGVVALRHPRPRYLLVLDENFTLPAENFEKELLGFHHYRVARELGQLAPAEVLTHSREDFFKRVHRSQVLGQNKLESLYFLEEW